MRGTKEDQLKEQLRISTEQRRRLELKKAELVGFKKDKWRHLDNRGKESWKVHYKHVNEQLKGFKTPLKEVAKKVLGSVLKKVIPLGALLSSSPAYKRGGLVRGKKK